jgi:hypothetical protein
VWIIRDEFTTPAASLGATRTQEPGPGTAAIVGGAYQSINSYSELAFESRGSLEQQYVTGPFTKDYVTLVFQAREKNGLLPILGLFSSGTLSSSNSIVSWSRFGADETMTARIGAGAKNIMRGCDQHNYQDYAIALNGDSGNRALMIYNGRLHGVFPVTNSTFYAAASSLSTASNLRIKEIGLVKLDGVWATAWGAATAHVASPSAGYITTMALDCIIECTFNIAAGVNQEIWVRRTDSDNGVIIRHTQGDPGTLKIIEKIAGVEYERASTAVGPSVGYPARICIKCFGPYIDAYLNNYALISYSSISLTGTGVYLSHDGTDYAQWPLDVALPEEIHEVYDGFFIVGDSISAGDAAKDHATPPYDDAYGYGYRLRIASGGLYREIPYQYANGGRAVTWIGDDPNLLPALAYRQIHPKFVIVLMGTNDLGLSTEENFKAKYANFLDRTHQFHPDALIICSHIWNGNYISEAAIVNGWIETVRTTRSAWALRGPDTDFGLSYYDADKIHFNEYGYDEFVARVWAIMQANA